MSALRATFPASSLAARGRTARRPETRSRFVGAGGRASRSAVPPLAAGADDLPDASDILKDFSLGKFVKKVQGKIPVVSLLSKLLTPEGGFDGETLSYNEYTRIRLDQAGGTPFGAALSDLCDETKKEPRTLLLLTWMAHEGDGLLGPEMVTSAAKRLGSSGFDYEYEIYRFEQARDAAISEMARKSGKRKRDPATAAAIAADALRFVVGPNASEATNADAETVAAGATESI
jgi:hypothetical protein